MLSGLAKVIQKERQACNGNFLRRTETYFVISFILFGLSIRLRNYLADLSLWNDEAALATNLVHLNFVDLFSPLKINQVAPIGFCIAEKFILSIWGNHELALRFLPYVAGSVAIIVTFILVYRAIGTTTAVLCLAQLAVIKEPIYFANNLKPYASDLAIAVGLMALAWTKDPFNSHKQFFVICISGIAALWFSFPAVFILASIVIVYGIRIGQDRQWHKIIPLSVISFTWLISFAIQFFLLQSQTHDDYFQSFWASCFLSLPPTNLEEVKQYASLLYIMFRNPLWTIHPVVSIPLYLTGSVLLWKQHRYFFLMISLPLVLNLIAAGLHKYPFGDRLLQYAVTNLYIPIAFCLAWMLNYRTKHKWVKWLAVLLIIANLAEPTVNGFKHLIWPRKYEQMKQVITYINTNRQNLDTLFVHHPAVITFEYYRDRFKMNDRGVIVSHPFQSSTPEKITGDITKLHGRVWILFGHGKQFKGVDYEKPILQQAIKHGIIIDQYTDIGAATYLFEFP